MKKERIDVLLVENGFFSSRQLAQRSIMAGQVFVNAERVDKSGTKVPMDAKIEVKGNPLRYVSRGGLKLEKAIQLFEIDMTDRVVLDIGASTGGFTDCALQHGARMVYAIDVGYGQLAWKIRQDPRVKVMERTNFRYLQVSDLNEDRPDMAVMDVSFISLALIFPVLAEIMPLGSVGVALVKPQFEAGREQVGKKGIVRDKKVHLDVLKRSIHYAHQHGLEVRAMASSPIQGGEGNIEFLSYFERKEAPVPMLSEEDLYWIVEHAHANFGSS